MLLSTSIVFPFYFPETISTMKAIQHFKAVTMRGTPTQFIGLKKWFRKIQFLNIRIYFSFFKKIFSIVPREASLI